jgi:DNA-binding PadR family transcriptional regulator
MKKEPLSTLGCAILGLLHQQPMSGYDLRKAFTSTPLIHFSDSPGSIYPAILRLSRQGLIARAAREDSSRRVRQIFRLTRKGRGALKRWLNKGVTRVDVISGMDELMLRLALMGGVVDREVMNRFLKALQKEVNLYIAELRRYYALATATMPFSGRLAMKSGMEGYRAQSRWVGRAIAELKRNRRLK